LQPRGCHQQSKRVDRELVLPAPENESTKTSLSGAMVNRGKPSRGCQVCRRRHIKVCHYLPSSCRQKHYLHVASVRRARSIMLILHQDKAAMPWVQGPFRLGLERSYNRHKERCRETKARDRKANHSRRAFRVPNGFPKHLCSSPERSKVHSFRSSTGSKGICVDILILQL
jgi:hypothetical protein